MTATMQTRDVYTRVTSQILEELEKGVVPWVRPWATGLPSNAVSRRPYRGINVLTTMLHQLKHGHASSEYVTFRQAKDLGGTVKYGERGALVVFFSRVDRHPTTAAEVAECEARYWWLAKPYTVFNLDQTSGLEGIQAARETGPGDAGEIPALCEMAREAARVTVRHGGQAAYYDPIRDAITLPNRASFLTPQAYASTLFHELVHSTGAAHRLDRNLSGRFGDPRYAMEELVAELGATFLAALAGIEHHTQAASYMASWITALKSDRCAIFSAARWATQAADYLQGDESKSNRA